MSAGIARQDVGLAEMHALRARDERDVDAGH